MSDTDSAVDVTENGSSVVRPASERDHAREEHSFSNFLDELRDWLEEKGATVEQLGEGSHGGAIWGVGLEDGTPVSLSVNVTP
jgi:hypothetical protein